MRNAVWCQRLKNDGELGLLTTDISKALNWIDNELLLAKLYAYGVDKTNSLYIIHFYLR